MIDSNDIVACVCEGNSEKYILSILLENDQLIFNQGQLLEGRFLQSRYRNSENFTNDYLTMDYDNHKIVVVSVQDSKTLYDIKYPYSNKIKETYLVVTSPEIEMLMIHALGFYKEYQKVKSNKKPSKFLSEKLKIKSSKVKSEKFIRDFFSKHSLVKAIIEYSSKNKKEKNIKSLKDLLKPNKSNQDD